MRLWNSIKEESRNIYAERLGAINLNGATDTRFDDIATEVIVDEITVYILNNLNTPITVKESCHFNICPDRKRGCFSRARHLLIDNGYLFEKQKTKNHQYIHIVTKSDKPIGWQKSKIDTYMAVMVENLGKPLTIAEACELGNIHVSSKYMSRIAHDARERLKTRGYTIDCVEHAYILRKAND